MSIYAIWPYFGILGLLLLIFSYSPIFKFIDEPMTKQRVSTLDGLRGFLALSVFLHHAVITYSFIQGKPWQLPAASPFYSLLGQTSVAFFFMISGFLFWGKVIREQSRLKWRALYIGRVFRIAPIYLVAVFSMFTIVFIRTGWSIHESFEKVADEIMQWLALGIMGKPDINGYRTPALILAGVTGSLHFEWIFYFSLRITSFLSGKKVRLPFVLGSWIATIIATFLCMAPGRLMWRCFSPAWRWRRSCMMAIR